MKSLCIVVIACIVAITLLATAPVSATQYRLVDLEAPGGHGSVAYGINNLGQVVGSFTLKTGARAFLWQDGSPMRDLGTLGGTFGCAYDINDTGQIVGASYPYGGDRSHAFLWQGDGPMTDLGTLGGDIAAARGINNSGQIAGSANLADDTTHTCLWQGGSPPQDLTPLAGPRCWAWEINNCGQVVGAAYVPGASAQHAMFCDRGSPIQDLGTLGGNKSTAYGINDNGLVVGSAEVSYGVSHAFIWQSGSPMQDLGTLQGNSEARDINACGLIVGYSFVGSMSQSCKPVVWENGSIQALDTLGGGNGSALAVNDYGWIVGSSDDSTGISHAVLWVPVPEPSSIFALLAGFAGIGGMMIRRKK